MGWNEAMDVENTRKLFNDEIRFAVSLWGEVTPIRIVNIEVSQAVGDMFSSHYNYSNVVV